MKDKLIGTDKTLDEQLEILTTILLQNKTLKEILEKLSKSNLKNYYVTAGAINQTIFNYYHDYELNYGIKDYDIVYFDNDLSYEKEDKIIKEISSILKDIDVLCDIKNEARVHIWYKDKFGIERLPYSSVEDAISRFGATITCIGVRVENNNLKVFAPYGLNDIFSMIIRPVKGDFTEEQYQLRCEKWKNKWPLLRIIPWNEN